MAVSMYFLISCSMIFQRILANEVVFPRHYNQENLATRINCQVGESRYFHYSSVTNLWGSIQGQITLNADINIYCLGSDTGGKYGEEALKYIVEVSRLKTEESHQDEPRQEQKISSTRRKRGIGDFFRNTWTKIKRFFGRMFGSGADSEEAKSFNGNEKEVEVADDTTTTPPVEEEVEGEDTMNYESIYSLPFEFVQLANGSIPELRFASDEVDGRVRNFKRHVVDSFATKLELRTNKMTKETSVIGEHLTSYNVTVGSKSQEEFVLMGAAIASPLRDRQQEENHVFVEKLITGDDILNLASSNQQSAALNDRDKIGLKSEQRQIFVNGKLVSSYGTSSISLNGPVENRRTKRSTEDLMSYLQGHSEFQLKLEKRRRRSLAPEVLQKLQQRSMQFTAASRFAENEDSSARQKLKTFQETVGNTTAFMENLFNSPSIEDENMQIVFEMVEEEVRLVLDQEQHSMAAAVRKTITEEKMLNLCRNDFNRCKDFLQLLALAGQPESEKILLSCLSKESRLGVVNRQQVADILSEVSRPSETLLPILIVVVEDDTVEPEVRGALCLSAASIATKSPDEVHKTKMAAVLISTLDKELPSDCSHNPLVLDLLEAIGNLGHQDTMDKILQVSSECSSKMDIQIACAHALRHMTSNMHVQQWMVKILESQSCDVIRAVIGSLLDEIAFQEKQRDTENWPRNQFNDVDESLKTKILSSDDDFKCAVDDAVRYFKKKRNERAKKIVDEVFSEDAEAWNPGSGSRQKRDLWDKLNCKEWTEDKLFRPIQDKNEFEADRAKYNKRKSCLASRTLGVPGANAEIYAGMFAGVKDPSDPPEYKLFTKFSSALNFLGHEMEIGSFYFYHNTGNTKAYVRIMGRTRQEFTYDGCTPTELKYRPITHIPLFLVTVSALQLSLGIHLSSQLSLDTLCPKSDVYTLQPLTHVRIGGEALGTVLFARGALNLGGNFNYNLQFTFIPHPGMCLEGHHGYDPMSISFEAYYQMWNVLKRNWGKHREWKPSSLKWNISNGRRRTWFNDTCVLKLSTDGSSRNNGESSLPDENDVLHLAK